MHIIVVILTVYLLSGCAAFPPEPPQVKGDYRPVNWDITKPMESRATYEKTFDFIFEGDITASIYALQKIHPQLTVLPPLGKMTPLPVRINLQATTLKDALRTIGEQGSGIADVVWNRTQQNNDQVFIRFRTAYSQPEMN